MAWNNVFWDAIDGLYWEPKRLGLKSIPREGKIVSDDGVFVPKDYLNFSGGLYRRVGTAKENIRAIKQSSENSLNDIFDLTLAIGSDHIRKRLVFDPLQIEEAGRTKVVGKNISAHFAWPKENENLTQHDGFYIGPNSSVCVELKLDASSSLDQVAKYAFLQKEEEHRRGSAASLGLLYIVPESKRSVFKNKYVDGKESVIQSILDVENPVSRNSAINMKISDDVEGFRSVLNRMNISVISWRDIATALEELIEHHGTNSSGDRTAARLLEGLLSQIGMHVGTEVVSD